MIEFALGPDGAAVGQHDVFGDGQSQTRTTGFARTGLIYPVEALEQAGQVFGRNAGTEILNIELHALRDRPRPQNDAAARSGIFQSIVHEVGKYLVDGFRISANLGSGSVFYL